MNDTHDDLAMAQEIIASLFETTGTPSPLDLQLAKKAREGEFNGTIYMGIALAAIRARDEQIAALLDRIERAEAALREIGAYGDKQASARLETTGSFGSFDEPGSVQISRAYFNAEPGGDQSGQKGSE